MEKKIYDLETRRGTNTGIITATCPKCEIVYLLAEVPIFCVRCKKKITKKYHLKKAKICT